MSHTRLTLINKSGDPGCPRIVIFQKNMSTYQEGITVAWKVIENLCPRFSHPFTYPTEMLIAGSDSFGNSSEPVQASIGEAFIITKDKNGDITKLSGKATDPHSIEAVNGLASGSVNVNIYKEGKLLAIKTGIVPTQKAVFIFKTSIWIDVVSENIQEGQILDSKIISGINTEFSLAGIKSADIIMTGGGQTPYRFALENIITVE